MKTGAPTVSRNKSPLRRNKSIEADYYKEQSAKTAKLMLPKTDAVKERTARQRSMSKLTAEVAAHIRWLYEAGYGPTKIAASLGETFASVSSVCYYASWRDIMPEKSERLPVPEGRPRKRRGA